MVTSKSTEIEASSPCVSLSSEDNIDWKFYSPSGKLELTVNEQALEWFYANQGQDIYLDMTVSPTVNQEGEIDGVLCTAVDVTEKRLFEVRLAAMAAMLHTA